MLQSKVALVTGGNRGIGKAIVLEFARRGINVAFCYLIHAQEAAIVEDEVKKSKVNSFAMQADVSNPFEVEAMIEKIIQRFGRLDILVNNAGIMAKGNVEDISVERWMRTIAVNLTGPFLTCKNAIPHMKKLGWGRIVNIASIAGLTAGNPGQTAGADYPASKAGLIGFTRRLAFELGPYGITANAVCPGAVDTPMHGDRFKNEETRKAVENIHPVRRIGKPQDVANVVMFLASPEAGFVTGASYTVTGGRIML
jgi:3-oxoacyl-[acyl-carrier protein] reductase